MKANELRIGNFVFFKSDITGQEKVMEINWQFFAEDFWIKDSRPIPLTEEWLLKFGFEKLKFSIPNAFDNRKIRIKEDKRGFWISAAYNFILLKSVHQLQNLYFALTGEELIYNP